MENKKSISLFALILIGINIVIGTGIFTNPAKIYDILGNWIFVILLVTIVLVFALSLVFAEVSSYFTSNGGPYRYIKETYGDRWGFVVGMLKFMSMAAALSTLTVFLGKELAPLVPGMEKSPAMQQWIPVGVVVLFGFIISRGVKTGKNVNNVITIAKLTPIIAIVLIGLVMVFSGSQVHAATWSPDVTGTTITSGIILLFYMFSGFESIPIMAKDVENPKKNVPRGILLTMGLITVIYAAVLFIDIKVLGTGLHKSEHSFAEVAAKLIGNTGGKLVQLGIVISITGIIYSGMFLTPPILSAIVEDGFLPNGLNKKNKNDQPYLILIGLIVIVLLLALAGKDAMFLGKVSVIARFAQYIPVSFALFSLRKRYAGKASYYAPMGPVWGVIAILVSITLLYYSIIDQAPIEIFGTPYKSGLFQVGFGLVMGLIFLIIYETYSKNNRKKLLENGDIKDIRDLDDSKDDDSKDDDSSNDSKERTENEFSEKIDENNKELVK